MIKKLLAIACLLALIVSSTSAWAFAKPEPPNFTDVALDDISEISDVNINVLTLSPDDFSRIDTPLVKEQLLEYVNDDGLVVYRDDQGLDASALDSYFNLATREVAGPSNEANSASSVDPGKDIAIIYYIDEYNMLSTHTINVVSADAGNSQDNDALIAEVVTQIVDKRDHPAEDVAPLASNISGTRIGAKSYTYSREPKGKLNAEYEFYTAQNINSKDYYLVFCDINGIPGAVLYQSNSAYEKKYEGEEMTVKLAPNTTSVELDDYGPDRTITSSAVSYSVEITVGGESITISPSASYTRNISDTTIQTLCNTTDAVWELTLLKSAQKNNCRFEPAATFACSSAKASIEINCFASYTLDSILTAQEEISLSRNITCLPTYIY